MSLAASTLVSTSGSASANSYVTLAEFTAYCERRLNVTAFDDAEPDDKVRALLMAARRLDQEQWLGSRASTTQALAWPRSGAPKRDADSWGTYYSTTEIPQAIKDAQCELALSLLDGFDDGEEDAIDSFSADGVSVKFRRDRPAGGLPVAVSHLISGLTRGQRLVRA